MSAVFTLAPLGESPAKLAPQNVRNRSLEPDDCLVFRNRTDFALSELTKSALYTSEDVAPNREVVELHIVPGSEAAAFSGNGVFAKLHSTVSRTALLTWLEALQESSDEKEAEAATKQLELYRKIREAFAEVESE